MTRSRAIDVVKDFLSGLKQGMHRFGQDIATLINTILLAIVYLLAVGITSVIARLFRKRFLETRLNAKAKTYWNTLNIKKRPTDEYYRQF
jgi:hypothetical protein